MADGPSGDRTERATPRRREKARERGQVAISQEVNSTIVLLAGVSLLMLGAGHMGRVLNINAAYLFSQIHVLRPDMAPVVSVIAGGNMAVLIKSLAPLLLAIMIGGLAANLMQVGWHVDPSAVAFRWENLNPVSGIKGLVGKRAWFEFFKNLLKVGLISLVSWHAIRGLYDDLPGLSLLPLEGAAGIGKSVVWKLLLRLIGLLAALAVLDWGFQKWQYEENVKMSRQELKEENRDLEGDPQVKARIRSIQMETARRRMMADVAAADVVVTNPTHFAVALKYVQGETAPKVVAKGQDELAQKIKKIARGARVPVIENKPLARGLYRGAKVGDFIPDVFYQAVAEVLAYVYRLKKA